jgi:hypothetical protein
VLHYPVGEDGSKPGGSSRFEFRDEVLEVDGDAQRSLLRLEVWGRVLSLLHSDEGVRRRRRREDHRLVVEDPEVLARPALMGIGEGSPRHYSDLLTGGDVVAVGSELVVV